jgi:hypothetical protein
LTAARCILEVDGRLASAFVGYSDVGSLTKHSTITSALVVIRAQSGEISYVLSGKDATMGITSPADSLLI